MKVLVGLSGGVDSAVTAARLLREGYKVEGLFLSLYPEADPEPARRVAEALGIPLHLGEAAGVFSDRVKKPWADAYLLGETPNPCARCNAVLKFPELLRVADAVGAARIATGHYAILKDGRLFRGIDARKDQSYFLAWTPRDHLARALMPLGGMTKPEVRALARSWGLPVAEKRDSQEICFVPDHSYGAVVAEMRPDAAAAGAIVGTRGEVLGQHDGFYKFTPGQRRGHGVALGAPAYVIGVDPQARTVTVSTDESVLFTNRVHLTGLRWSDPAAMDGPLLVRVRHGGALIPAHFQDTFGPQLVLGHAVRAAVPGQLAALYRGDEVVGAGWITREP